MTGTVYGMPIVTAIGVIAVPAVILALLAVWGFRFNPRERDDSPAAGKGGR